ncbi:class I histocompatibility antigen, F10 alpha chain-like isoform X3 [Lepisosteus oculatus]|uniref:class I histocompatibility antigen, F10 alpha chain-like isoform X3 n=1 Tax=Lepisosteus oculatus TaxID=7918 RepID=UPI0035F519A8
MFPVLVLVLALCRVQAASAVTHSLRYFYTGVTGASGFPEYTAVGLVDGQEFVHYDSDIKRAEPKTEWIERNVGKDYWDTVTQINTGTSQVFKADLQIAMQRFNQTGGVHTFQKMYGCEWDEETGATGGFQQYGYDGRDWLVFDLKTLSWTAPVPQAFQSKLKWDANRAFNEGSKTYLTQECIEWLKKYVDYGRETLERGVQPDVSVFQRPSSFRTELTCLATGFFPRDIVVSWWRDRQELHEDVESGEVVPNMDGTFQIRKSLTVKREELDKHQYSCRVDHKSLDRPISVSYDKTGRHREGEPKGGFPVGIIVVVGVLVLIAVVGIVIWRKRQTGYGKASTSDSDSNSSNNPPAKA